MNEGQNIWYLLAPIVGAVIIATCTILIAVLKSWRSINEKVTNVEKQVIRLEGLFEGQQITESKLRFEELMSLVTKGRQHNE